MGLSAATFAASFAPGPIGDMAQKVAPVVAGFQTLSMILPMLSNPFVALGAAVVALGVGFWAFNKSAQKAAKELADSAKKKRKQELEVLKQFLNMVNLLEIRLFRHLHSLVEIIKDLLQQTKQR